MAQNFYLSDARIYPDYVAKSMARGQAKSWAKWVGDPAVDALCARLRAGSPTASAGALSLALKRARESNKTEDIVSTRDLYARLSVANGPSQPEFKICQDLQLRKGRVPSLELRRVARLSGFDHVIRNALVTPGNDQPWDTEVVRFDDLTSAFPRDPLTVWGCNVSGQDTTDRSGAPLPLSFRKCVEAQDDPAIRPDGVSSERWRAAGVIGTVGLCGRSLEMRDRNAVVLRLALPPA